MPKVNIPKFKMDIRAKIARAYLIDLICLSTDLDHEQDEILCEALNIISTATIPPQDE